MQHAIDSPIDPARPRVDPRGLRTVPGTDFATVGIGCPSCANRVRNALLAYPGIVEVKVDVSAGLCASGTGLNRPGYVRSCRSWRSSERPANISTRPFRSA